MFSKNVFLDTSIQVFCRIYSLSSKNLISGVTNPAPLTEISSSRFVRKVI
jgi:hypothetical protein